MVVEMDIGGEGYQFWAIGGWGTPHEHPTAAVTLPPGLKDFEDKSVYLIIDRLMRLHVGAEVPRDDAFGVPRLSLADRARTVATQLRWALGDLLVELGHRIRRDGP